MHVLHQGRARYTLITPRPSDASTELTPEVTYPTMGSDQDAGETRQLFVAGGIWKMSAIPEEDLVQAKKSQTGGEKIGCLISEVVTPGFVWQDHEWMKNKDLVLPYSADLQHMRDLCSELFTGECTVSEAGTAIDCIMRELRRWNLPFWEAQQLQGSAEFDPNVQQNKPCGRKEKGKE